MTKKHFIALADHIRRDRNTRTRFAVFSRDAVESLADFCATQNPQFNRERWLDYIAGRCGPNGGSINKHMDER